ncbi:MAG: hypothetical protein MHM6MM_001413 [Cercozoa sp. M6MM]
MIHCACRRIFDEELAEEVQAQREAIKRRRKQRESVLTHLSRKDEIAPPVTPDMSQSRSVSEHPLESPDSLRSRSRMSGTSVDEEVTQKLGSSPSRSRACSNTGRPVSRLCTRSLAPRDTPLASRSEYDTDALDQSARDVINYRFSGGVCPRHREFDSGGHLRGQELEQHRAVLRDYRWPTDETMGVCASDNSEEAQRKRMSKRIDQQNARSFDRAQEVKKLLLLGAGESGKSTLFKQMIRCYGKGFTDAERASFITVVHANTLGAMQTLCTQSQEMLAAGDADCKVAATESFDRIQKASPDDPVTETLASDIELLWKDAGIQHTFSRRTEFQFPDSAEYFFGRVKAISAADFMPDDQDVLRTRVRTTGIVETSFAIDGNEFKLFDVGGQRNERKKWIHCFEGVTALIFVAAISEYDQMLYEDHTTNRMDEALRLFDEICNLRWFRETSMILFLNKRDLFEEKIKHVPLTVCFRNYPNGDSRDPELAYAFFKQQFEQLNRNQENTVYTHITCATDKNNIFHVFNSVKDIIITRSLRGMGLML